MFKHVSIFLYITYLLSDSIKAKPVLHNETIQKNGIFNYLTEVHVENIQIFLILSQ